MFARMATRTGVQLPSPPVFARNEVESEDCRAVASAKAGLSDLQRQRCELRLGRPARQMRRFTYVYVLQSDSNPRRFYTGHTNDLRERLTRHNGGKVPHTAKWKPWQIKTYVGFSDLRQAVEFERYLKTASGRAFLKKRL
jgi:predicted GIY-YIG superfamily endonuclease